MILTLLSHQWKAFWRSRSAGKNLAAQIVMGFVILYLLACAIVLGFSFRHLLPELFPGQDVIKVFCGLILYYFLGDILMRFLIQELPVLSVQPYLAQNIRRRQLVRFLNVRSIFHFLNLLPIFIFIPFVITVIGPAYGPLPTACFVIGFLINYLTPEEYFYFVGSLNNRSRAYIDDFLRNFDAFFDGGILRSGKYIRDLSKGNQFKVGIAACLLREPQVLILDEPFANLDPSSQLRLIKMLKEVAGTVSDDYLRE